jgi:NMD protein affecting ribosome stability and mRNA decay
VIFGCLICLFKWHDFETFRQGGYLEVKVCKRCGAVFTRNLPQKKEKQIGNNLINIIKNLIKTLKIR